MSQLWTRSQTCLTWLQWDLTLYRLDLKFKRNTDHVFSRFDLENQSKSYLGCYTETLLTSSNFSRTFFYLFLHTHTHQAVSGCHVAQALMQYCVGANYYWLLVEGLYLHNLLVMAVFSDSRCFYGYLIIGWGTHTHKWSHTIQLKCKWNWMKQEMVLVLIIRHIITN